MRSSLRHQRRGEPAAALEGRDAGEQLRKHGVIAERVATRRGTPEGDGARRRRRTGRAREGSEGAAGRTEPEATDASRTIPGSAADNAGPTKADVRCHTDWSGGTKEAELGRIDEGRSRVVGWRRRLEVLLRCDEEGELLQIDQRRGVGCAGGVAGGRAVDERLNISHSANDERRSRGWYKISKLAVSAGQRSESRTSRFLGRECNSRPR